MDDHSFRTWQAITDLTHHAGPLITRHFRALAAACGLTPQQAGAAVRALRNDYFRFQSDQTLALLDGLEKIARTGAEGFDLAITLLLADRLQTGRAAARLSEAWQIAATRLPNQPDTRRAAMANGLRRALQLGLIKLRNPPADADCKTRDAAPIAEHLLRIARSMRPDELQAVAGADYGMDVDRHGAALREVIAHQDGVLLSEQSWYPSEVIELTAHVASAPGFEGCTAILLLTAFRQGDQQGWFDFRWELLSRAYCSLRPSTRDPILAAIRYLYETDPDFLTLSTVGFSPRPRTAESPDPVQPTAVTIPVVDSL